MNHILLGYATKPANQCGAALWMSGPVFRVVDGGSDAARMLGQECLLVMTA